MLAISVVDKQATVILVDPVMSARVKTNSIPLEKHFASYSHAICFCRLSKSMKSYSVNIQVKAIRQYAPVVFFVCQLCFWPCGKFIKYVNF